MASPQEFEDILQAAETTDLAMAVVGLAGQGKSTLVNSLLLIDPDSEEAAETGDEGLSVSNDVICYTKGRDNATVKIWDTPGLQDDSTMKQETVIKLLRERAGDDVDLFLYCVAYYPGIRISDESRVNVVKYLTKHFGKELWRKTILVLTMVNTIKVERRKIIPKLAQNIENGLKNALRGAGVPEDIVQSKRLMLAGLAEEPLAINENENVDWNEPFFVHCFDAIQEERKRATFIQARYGRSFWRYFIDYLSRDEENISGAAGSVGLGVGAVGGAKVGAMIGPVAIAVASSGGTGAIAVTVGGSTVAAAGTVAGTVAAAGTAAGTMAAAAGTTAVAGTLGAGVAAGAVGTAAGTMAAAAGTTAVAGTLGAGVAAGAVGTAAGTTAAAAGTTAVAGTLGAGAVGTSAMAGAGGTLAAATGKIAVAVALPAATVTTFVAGVGALGLGVLTTYYVMKYLRSRKKKEIE